MKILLEMNANLVIFYWTWMNIKKIVWNKWIELVCFVNVYVCKVRIICALLGITDLVWKWKISLKIKEKLFSSQINWYDKFVLLTKNENK